VRLLRHLLGHDAGALLAIALEDVVGAHALHVHRLLGEAADLGVKRDRGPGILGGP
jgi:hypothetical protein